MLIPALGVAESAHGFGGRYRLYRTSVVISDPEKRGTSFESHLVLVFRLRDLLPNIPAAVSAIFVVGPNDVWEAWIKSVCGILPALMLAGLYAGC